MHQVATPGVTTSGSQNMTQWMSDKIIADVSGGFRSARRSLAHPRPAVVVVVGVSVIKCVVGSGGNGGQQLMPAVSRRAKDSSSTR